MNNTDYSTNLRPAKQNSAKNKVTNSSSVYSTQNRSTNPLLTVVVVVLILVAIFQMDPANAEPTLDVGGYGTLVLMDSDQLIKATTIKSNLNMLVEDDQSAMIIDQTFSNHTRQVLNGEYRLAVPSNARISAIHTQINQKTKSTLHGTSHNVRRIKNQLLVQTRPLEPNQQIRVHLKITYHNSSSKIPPTSPYRSLVKNIHSNAP